MKLKPVAISVALLDTFLTAKSTTSRTMGFQQKTTTLGLESNAICMIANSHGSYSSKVLQHAWYMFAICTVFKGQGSHDFWAVEEMSYATTCPQIRCLICAFVDSPEPQNA